MMSDAEKLAVIRDYVVRKRAQCGIVPGRTVLPELSCEAFGEFYNLVERQLMNTEKEHHGKKCDGNEECGWCELAYPPVLDGAYWYVVERIRGHSCAPFFIRPLV